MRKYSATATLFKTPMVQSIQADRKTQTRRVVNLLKGFGPVTELIRSTSPGYDYAFRDHSARWHEVTTQRLLECCPYGKVGEKLWVRETWGKIDFGDDESCWVYRADDNLTSQHGYADYFSGWKPSIHMPYEACRLWLEITGVRVERLQDISEADAIAEGIQFKNNLYYMDYLNNDEEGYMDTFTYNSPGLDLYRAPAAVASYCTLWDKINGQGAWAKNPLVFVIEFRKTTKPLEP